MSLPYERFEPLPTAIDRSSANQLRTIFAESVASGEDVPLELALGKGETAKVVLSPLMAKAFLEMARIISSGRSLKIMAVDAELTTQQAADILNVSRPYFVKLLESGEIKFTKTGRHRRVLADDVFAYRETRDAERERLLSEMALDDADYL